MFGVLTHRDKAGPSYQEREEKFLRALGIPRTRFVSCLCYCDDYAREVEKGLLWGQFPEIDVPILGFLTSVCNPTTLILNEKVTYSGRGMGIMSKIKAIPTEDLFYYAFILGMMVLLISFLVIKDNNQPFNWDELESACSELDSLEFQTDFIQKLCTPNMQITLTKPHFQFLPIFIVALVFLLESIYREICFAFFKRYVLYGYNVKKKH